MFNWFKKITDNHQAASADKATPQSQAGTITDDKPNLPPATAESEILKKRGSEHLTNGRLNEAADCYRQAIARDPLDAEAHYKLGNVLDALGRLEEAVSGFRRAVEIKPDYTYAHSNLGSALKALGRFKEAEKCFRRAVEITPDLAGLHYNLGLVLDDLGRFEEAVESYRTALELQPDNAEGHRDLAILLVKAKHLPEAERAFRRALELSPEVAEFHFSLGNVLKDMGQLDNAEASYRQAIRIKGDYADAHSNLGVTLCALGRLEEAEVIYRRAMEINPKAAEGHCILGDILYQLGRLEEAEINYRRALEIKPDYTDALNNLGVTLQKLGRLEEAEASYQRVVYLKPDFAEAHNNLGGVLQALGRLAEAETSCRRAIQLNPLYAEAYINLGNIQRDLGQLDNALASHQRAVEIKPNNVEALINLGHTQNDLQRLDEAVASHQRVLEIKPDYAEGYSNLLFLQSYHATLGSDEYLALARGWEHACVPAQDRQVAHDRVFQRQPLAGRRLRVGYVSGDFRQHAMSHFIEPLFEHHDRTRIELFAYSSNGKKDAVTQRLQSLVDRWVLVTGVADDVIRDRIEADGIDVLVDLSGHTAHNRMGVFARRAAPVQAHYLGYFASTGLTEMDYLIGDQILTPPEMDSQFSEQVWRLDRVRACYEGKTDAPPLDWKPDHENRVWLGSFNILSKLTSATLSLWAKVLHALPEAKLLLKTKELADPGNRRRILDILAELGIVSNRIELQDSKATPGWSEHMAYYNRLDIALDPVGAHGGYTTTCDALWMGVPVITLGGDHMASRMAASILNAIGRPEWITSNEDEYLNKVVALARDMEQRKAVRSVQRERMAASPLCDARGLAFAMEDAYRAMFESWRLKAGIA